MELIKKYFPDLTDTQIFQFSQLENLYLDWNSKINVISRKDMDNFYLHHVLHSLAIAKVYNFKSNSKVLDVGTGGGFPGIPLAVLFPETNFKLIDSIGKKITVVKEVASSIGLKNVDAEKTRSEDMKGVFDVIVSRAVTEFPKFMNLIKPHLCKQTGAPRVLYLKGGDFAAELSAINYPYFAAPISEFFHEDFFKTKFVVKIF
ncbi:MAG: 16S rRNA (guanine(527)-N(7))-methyltransferase RsmG [Bacteroidales bacterium]|nr:16S rRNA (guanine(527)-N(7))-methyltransferase RsmG [Bacteroidales bacterium]